MIGLAILWLAALEFCLRSLDIKNDQYGRISPGWHILRFGELPFRDFLDPGYFLTEFSSAGVQWLFGQNLLGELLLNSLFIASGCVCVGLLTRRLTHRLVPSVAAGVLALIALPRAYDYDKALFYPMGLLVTSRWLEKPTRGRAFAVALTLVIAAMYRYDNGVFLGIATLVAALVLWWREWRRLAVASGPLAAMVVGLSLPVLLFLQLNGGIGDAADQALTYGLREGARTRIDSLPRIHPGRVWNRVAPPRSENAVRVRWAATVTSTDRQQLTRDLGLTQERQVGAPEDRTWLYTLADESPTAIRRLVNHPQVEDTAGIDRGRLQLLEAESWLRRLERASPLFRIRILPDAWTDENAAAILYYLLIGLTAIGAVTLIVTRSTLTAVERARLAAVIALCALLCVFILRSPVSARVGGMAGPFCAAGGWMLSRLTRRAARLGVLTTTAVVLLACWSLNEGVGWYRQLFVPFVHPRGVVARLRAFAQVPPSLDLLPSGRTHGLVEYVKGCTGPEDRVFTSWFSPELFYFAQRGFGGAVSANFGGHWSEPRFQHRTIAALESHPTPLVIVHTRNYDQFRVAYPLVAAYVTRHYALAGVTDFADPDFAPDGYSVLVRADRLPAKATGPFGLPCFVGAASL